MLDPSRQLQTFDHGHRCRVQQRGHQHPITMSQGRDQDSNAPIFIFILPIKPSSKTDAHATGIVGGGSIGSPLFLPIAASR